MPKVPMDVPQASLNVPGVNQPLTREFGKIGQATEALGGDIEDSSLKIGQQVAEADAQTRAALQYGSDKIASEQKMTELKASSPDGYMHDAPTPDNPQGAIQFMPDGTTPKDIMQGYHEWADDRFQKSQAAMPNDLGRAAYTQKSIPYFSDATGTMALDTQQAKVAQMTDARAQNTQDVGNSLANNPDMMSYYGKIQDMTNLSNLGVQSGLYNQTAADAQLRTEKEQVSRQVMQGAYDQIKSDRKQGDDMIAPRVQDWINKIHGLDPVSVAQKKNGVPTLSDNLNPEQKTVEVSKLLSLIPAAKAADSAYRTQQIADTTAMNSMGKYNPNQNNAMLQFLSQDTAMTQSEKIENASKLISSKYIGMTHGSAYISATPDQRKALDDQIFPKIQAEAQDFSVKAGYTPTLEEAGAFSKSAQAEVRAAHSQVESSLEKDSAAVFGGQAADGTTVSPTYNKAVLVAKSVSPIAMGSQENIATFQKGLQDLKPLAQTSLGMNFSRDYRPIDKDLSQKWSTFLQGTPDATGYSTKDSEQAQGAAGIQAAAGKDFPAVVNTMIKDGLPKQYVLMGSIPTFTGKQDLMGALSHGGTMLQSFEQDHIKDPNVNKELLMQQTAALTRGFTDDLAHKYASSGTSAEYSVAVNQAVAANAAGLFKQRSGTSNADLQKAVTDSYNTFVGNHVYQGDPNRGLVKMGLGGYNSGLQNPPVVPKEWMTPDEHSATMNNLQHIATNPDMLRAMGAIEAPSPGRAPLGDLFYKSATNPENNPRFTAVEDPVKGRGFNMTVDTGPNHDRTVLQSGSPTNPTPLFIPLNKVNALPATGVRSYLPKFMGGT